MTQFIRGSYSDEEWLTLQFGVLWVFYYVARIDGSVSEDEFNELFDLVVNQDYEDPLFGAVLRSIGPGYKKVADAFQLDTRTTAEGLTDIKSIVYRKLALEDARSFMNFLVVLGSFIAAAPKGYGTVENKEIAALQVMIDLTDS